MGQNESAPDGTAVSIEKQTEDAFDVVHVSDDVLRRLQQQRRPAADGGDDGGGGETGRQLREQLDMERSKNHFLMQQWHMREQPVPDDFSLDDRLAHIDERERQLHQAMSDKLKERIGAVDERYFTEETQGVCADVQSWVHECYTSADGRQNPLKCRVFANMFKECVRDYRQKMLAQNA